MRAIRGIERGALDLIKESAREIYPNEFGGFLSVGDDPSVISEIVLLPGTISGSTHAIFRLDMSPPDSSIVGTVHSHPSGSPRPSEADLHLFQKYGRVHVIIAEPYDDTSWRAYDYRGEPLTLEVVEL
jgi:proteasome lid subunit RPN8/RPN11